MRHGRRALATLFLSVSLLIAGVAAQQAPVFRTATQFVVVDAVVTGKDDVPVTNLTRDDFEITENGRPQRIAEFSLVSIPIAHRAIDVDAPPQPPSDVATNGESAQASRAIVILVDDSSLTSVMFCEGCPDVLVSTKNALTRFLQSLTSDDQVAMVWTGRSDVSQDFTNDIPRLIAAVNNRKAAMGLTALGPAWRPRVESLKFAIGALAGSHYARRALVFVGVHACSGYSTASFEGVECQDVYKRAKDANVPIYTMDPRVNPPPPADDTMAELAINTGGRHFLLQSNPLGAVDKLLTDNGSFYTLGFYPEPLTSDGKYHEIKVTVKQPGLRVRSRDRYLADTAAPATSTPTRDMTKALGAGLDDPGLPVRVFAAPLALTARGLTRTLITIDLAYPTPEGGRGALADDLRVGILALSPDGKIKASFQRPIEFKGQWKPAAQGRFVINELIDLPPEQLTLRVGITSRALGRTGTAHIPLNVPNFKSTDLRVSPLVIGAGGTGAADAAIGLDRVRTLVPFQPTTARTFTAAQTLRVLMTAVWRSSATALAADVTITGGPAPITRHLSVDAAVAEGGGRQARLDTSVPLSGLAAGEYVLSVHATTGKGKPAVREVPFVVR